MKCVIVCVNNTVDGCVYSLLCTVIDYYGSMVITLTKQHQQHKRYMFKLINMRYHLSAARSTIPAHYRLPAQYRKIPAQFPAQAQFPAHTKSYLLLPGLLDFSAIFRRRLDETISSAICASLSKSSKTASFSLLKARSSAVGCFLDHERKASSIALPYLNLVMKRSHKRKRINQMRISNWSLITHAQIN